MNFALLEKMDEAGDAVLATILSTKGHTYKKEGERALYALDSPYPVYGNLGSLCADQEIVTEGRKAHTTGKPRVITIDTSDISDAHLGGGTYCGGVMEVLLEPVLEKHKNVYRRLRRHLEKNERVQLIHDLDSGTLSLSRSAPEGKKRLFVESIPPRPRLFLCGATPLAHQLVRCIDDMAFQVHVIDWRSSYLDTFRNTAGVVLHEDEFPFDEESMVVLLSHSFERDKAALKKALSLRCAYVGLLSSTTRRDQIYNDRIEEGIPEAELERVSSPIGIDIGGRSDAEIAVSIVAELIRIRNQ